MTESVSRLSDANANRTPIHLDMLIGGVDVAGESRIEVRNPARLDEIVGTISRGRGQDVNAAAAAARKAYPAWSALGWTGRAAALREAFVPLADEGARAELAKIYSRENGKVAVDALGELAGTYTRSLMTFEFQPELEATRVIGFGAHASEVRQIPYGVVASIVPWNGPVVLGFTQIVAALFAGNTVVVKPPETCPLTLMLCLRRMAARLPAGILNIVTGTPADVGPALLGSSLIDKIAFTGSIASARRIVRDSADSIKHLTLELGGNDPAILLDDLDFDSATMERLMRSAFRSCGQICMAVKRIYVPAKRLGEFEAVFVAAANRICVGNGLEEGVSMGPVHTHASIVKIAEMVSDAQAKGARIVEVGEMRASANPANGYFVRPKVVLDAKDNMRVTTEEQFAPIVPVLAYDDVEEALSRANATEYGLGGSVWGRDVARAKALAWRIEAGTVWVNAHGTAHLNHRAPYGGTKQSGIGRKSGVEGVLEYLQSQTLSVV